MQLIRRSLSLIIAASLLTAAPAGAAADKQLVAVRGTSGYQPNTTGEFRRVVSRQVLADENVAVTQAASNALVVLPDSSEVALGASTSVQVGAFNDPLSTTPTSVTLRNGALRLNVKHPAGARSNYVFQTSTSQIAVRGTVALYKHDDAAGDVISCLQCDPGDVVVTIDGKTYALLTGATLFITGAHVVTTSTSPQAPIQAFAGTGLATTALTTTTAVASAAFTPEVEAAARAAAAGSGAAGAGAGAAAGATADTAIGIGVVAGAAAAGIISANKTNPTHGVTAPPPNVSGSATITGTTREPAPAPSPSRAPH